MAGSAGGSVHYLHFQGIEDPVDESGGEGSYCKALRLQGVHGYLSKNAGLLQAIITLHWYGSRSLTKKQGIQFPASVKCFGDKAEKSGADVFVPFSIDRKDHQKDHECFHKVYFLVIKQDNG